MKYNNLLYLRKMLDLILILICIFFIILGVYGHFVVKRISFQDFFLGTLGFGACIIIGTVYLTSKHKAWFIPKEKLTRKQSIEISICGFIFSIGSLWIAITGNLHFSLRIILLIGVLSFGIGSLSLLFRQWNKET